MLRLSATEMEKQALAYERVHHPHVRVRRSMDVLWLQSQGLARQDIARLAGVSPKTLRSYFRDYQAGTRTVFFVDAAYFVLGAFMLVLWCVTRVWIKTPSGRQRFNVLGALNAVSQEVITVVNATDINSHCVCPLLDTLAALTPQRPITVVSDNERLLPTLRTRANARRPTQHRTALSTGLLPNLNLIERLWKFVKKQCLYGQALPRLWHFQ